ncbi:MAG: hypothetical protein AAFU77_13760 [Myxococcota bacterium]
MADGGINSGNNFSRFQVFTGGVPSNIAQFGYTADEAKIVRGEPEQDVRIAPMAAPEVTEVQLALTHRVGSDVSRLASPNDPGFNPFEGPKSMLQLNRAAIAKMTSPVVSQVADVVSELMQSGAPNAKLMDDSLNGRLVTACHLLSSLEEMASSVQARQAQNLS